MFKTTAGRYLAFVIILGMSLVTLMFMLEPKMMIPSIIGGTLFMLIIYVFYRVNSKKSNSEQKRIAVRNGKIAYAMIVILLAIFFIAAAKYHNVSVGHFIRLWFNL